MHDEVISTVRQASRAAIQIFNRGGRTALGEIWLTAVRVQNTVPPQIMQEVFSQTFLEEAHQAAEDGDTERVTELFRCLCDHVLPSTAWWHIRDWWVQEGIDHGLLRPKYRFPHPVPA